jgi:hypothetical protein
MKVRTSVILLAVIAMALAIAAPSASAAGTIVSRGQAASATWGSASTTNLTLQAPGGSQPGDVLIASLGFGKSGAAAQPTLTAPAGWMEVSRTNQGSVGTLAVYSHVFSAGETSYTWTTNVAVGGAAFIAAFGGVDTTSPIDASRGQVMLDRPDISTPSVTTGAPGSGLVASYYGYMGGKDIRATWKPPSGMSEIGDANNGSSRSGTVDFATQSSAGSTGAKKATASKKQTFGIGVLTALRPSDGGSSGGGGGGGGGGGPVPEGVIPLTIDTDMWSSADDVGALATAFGLQLKGEARVIGIGVNTRTSRPSVATDSWKCTAAIAQFYNSGDVPIGTSTPNNGTSKSSPDWAGPCAGLASAGTPVPGSAVTMYRRALASQADGSVVMTSVGYLENLSALLNSPGDSISPLNGRDLIAKKVNRLVVMGGGYPSRSGETNLSGDPLAAQNVAAHWPTKVVWAGYEVGDNVHTGQTICDVHPSDSPVEVSYRAFTGCGRWYYSYDLTAVYHAVRPTDSSMTETGPGTNVINSSGGNSFSSGSGDQYYLRLNSESGAEAAIEELLDTLPTGAPPPPPPGDGPGPNDAFDNNSLDPSQWTATGGGSTVAAANQELEITHNGGSWTKGVVDSALYDQTGHSVQVQVKRAANAGRGGSTYGETAIFLRRDATHYAYFFIGGGSMTAWVNRGSGEVSLTSGWPVYDSTSMQWLRFRESGGTLYWEYSSSGTGPWTVLAQTADPFPMTGMRFRISAGSNLNAADMAQFDNVATN